MKSKETITDLVEVPLGFIKLTRFRGFYIVGDDILKGSRVPISPAFQRELGLGTFLPLSYDVLLGILSVLIIGLLTEIAKSILLRSRRQIYTRDEIAVAYLVDEVSHFRNILTIRGTNNESRDIPRYRYFRRKRALLSFFVLLISITIFLADVAAVYMTQPRTVLSKESQFNVVGLQPVSIPLGHAGRIQEATEGVPCVSPFHVKDLQKRHFRIIGCITYDENRKMAKKDDFSEEITISSWYHEGGSDHNVSFGDGWRSLSVRAELVLDDPNHTTQRILFNSSTGTLPSTRYLHNLTIFRAMQFACTRDDFEGTCAELIEELEFVSAIETEREIELWATDDGNIVRANSTGLVSQFRIRMRAPFKAVSSALRVLVASTALMERNGRGWYEAARDGVRREGIPGLIEENGRVTGIYFLALIIIFAIATLLALRFFFDPVSLAHIALRSFQKEEKRRKMRKTRYATTRAKDFDDSRELIGAGQWLQSARLAA